MGIQTPPPPHDHRIHNNNTLAEPPVLPIPVLRFAILLAGHASEYVRKSYHGVSTLFRRMLSDPGEQWDTFSVIDHQFPSDADLNAYHGFIVTGSRHDAHGSEPWVLHLCELIRRIHSKRKKLLGICFGHQVISRALGGKTGRAANGWECGIRKITVEDAMYSKPYGLMLPSSSLSIIEMHQDEVLEIPPGGDVLATSATTKIEIFAVRNEVLGIQGHPEFTEDITLDILNSRNFNSCIPAEIVDQAIHSFKEGRPDREIFHQLCKSFLKDSL